MEGKKERSSRKKLKVEMGRGSKGHSLLLANPMAGGEVIGPRATAGLDHVQPKAAPWKKSAPKSPSILRFFVRGGRKPSEETDDSLSCDPDDGLSVSWDLALGRYLQSTRVFVFVKDVDLVTAPFFAGLPSQVCVRSAAV